MGAGAGVVDSEAAVDTKAVVGGFQAVVGGLGRGLGRNGERVGTDGWWQRAVAAGTVFDAVAASQVHRPMHPTQSMPAPRI